MGEKPLKELMQERKDKMNKLIEMGIDPFGKKFDKNSYSNEIKDEFKSLEKGEKTDKNFTIAGRIKSIRKHGKLAFADIEDEKGQIQILLEEKSLGKDFDVFKEMNIGDIMGIQGNVFRSKAGEISLWSEKIEMLSKSLRPPPSEKYGLKDPEIRYRQRYADLIVNSDVKEVFKKRAKIVSEMRTYLEKRGFIEITTPALQPLYGGAFAEPFVTHHNALDRDLYLRISPELYLKRAIVGGFEKVYEICKNFRNEGIDTKHNPEFTMMELYWAYADYTDNMKLTEEMIAHIAKKITGGTKVKYNGKEIELKPPWERLTMYEAIKKYLDVDVERKNINELKEIAEKLRIDIPKYADKGVLIAEIFELVEPKIVQPTFIIDFPVEISPLAKAKKDEPEITERFEVIICGQEYANAYSELNNPIEQRERFSSQMNKRDAGDKEAQPLDEDFIRALEYGMAPTSGLGIGIDRLVMLLTGKTSIRDVIMFPTMKERE